MHLRTAAGPALIIVLLSGFAFTGASAQPSTWAGPRPEQNMVEDQPGLVPSEDEEQLPVEFQKQAVFFRTTEAPGTIVVNTSEIGRAHV